MPAESTLNYASLPRLKVAETLASYYPKRRRNSFGNLCSTLETLIAFGDRATGEHIFPSIAEVARLTGSCYRTIQRHLDELVELGILKKVKQYVFNLCLPYEFALSREFATKLLRTHFGRIRDKMQRTKLYNSLQMLERSLVGEPRSIPWRRKNKKPGPPPPARSPGKALPVDDPGLIGQHSHLPPSLRSGDRDGGGLDGFAAMPSPSVSLTSSAPAGASTPTARFPHSSSLLEIWAAIRAGGN